MIRIKLQGGLGNQIFQIFACMSHAIKMNTDYMFSMETSKKRHTYWTTLFNKVKNNIGNSPTVLTYQEKTFSFHPVPYHPDMLLIGYFQSEKYFKSRFDQIVSILGLRDKQIETYKHHKELLQRQTVSMHFRIGDYALKPDKHPVQSISYYANALAEVISRIGTDIDVIVFNEEQDSHQVTSMIERLTDEFPGVNFIGCKYSIPDYEQLLLMSLCQHNIIANSSFSWWGAYLNLNTYKMVIYPIHWFGPAMNGKSINDLIPEGWLPC